ncbi:MAG: hypothetical protein COB53_01935 [Elusimicrobia bacterium]|nr:MAG: hypothetical protein COB53_01935 [Elusimicrobiota bacterium]
MIISLIAAVSDNSVIGKDNALPWGLHEDLKRFKSLTVGHTIVMGRRTYESIGRALPRRRNVILTTNPDWKAEDADRAGSLAEAIGMASVANETELFIIGGERVYRDAMSRADRIYLTRVSGEFEGDAFFPEFDASQFDEVEREEHSGPPPFVFLTLQRKT